MKKSLLAFALASATLAPSLAAAQELADRKSPLADAPAVRLRQELRAQRFELGAGLGSSLAADFYNAVLVNARMAYHLSDWLAIGATFGQNLTPDYKTGLTEELVGSLEQRAPDDRGPEAEEALGGMNKMSQVLTLQAEIVPITGKFSLFGKWFADYDLYALAGVGAMNFTASGDTCDTPMAGDTCPDVGMKVGGALGFGVHTFINRFLALNFEVKDLIVSTNRAGRDVNADTFVDDKDNELTNNWVLALNLNVFFPTLPKISD